VLTDDEVVAYFTSVAPGNLMAPIGVTLANATRLARLCPIPLAWAAYFLDSKSPFEAWQMGRDLIATLDTPDERDRVAPLASWLRAACVKRGLAAADRRISCLDTSWAALAPDARVVRWAAHRLAPYRKPQAAAAPATAMPTGLASVAMAASAAVAASTKKEYTPLEIQKIQAGCSLTPDIYDAELPEIFTRMLEEGRTSVRTQALMRELLMPDEEDMFNAVQVLVSEEMAKDFKNLDFGFNGDTTYSTCHRGISPFMVIPVSLAQASQRRRMAERYARAGSNLTLDDITTSETIPDATPSTYRELMDVMKNYCFFLQRLLGARCSHFLETRAITRILGRKRREFESISARQVATILWHVFMDARQFFSTTVDITGSLPESNLRVARGMIETTMIPAQMNVPFQELLGVNDETSGAGGQESFEQPRAGRVGEAPAGQRVFARIPGPIKTALAGARQKYPNLRVADLMGATTPPLKYSTIRVGPTGACLDMLCFGICKEPDCTYKHPTARINIDPARAAAAATKLKAGYAAYEANHPGG
jgi:hypothetical protein